MKKALNIQTRKGNIDVFAFSEISIFPSFRAIMSTSRRPTPSAGLFLLKSRNLLTPCEVTGGRFTDTLREFTDTLKIVFPEKRPYTKDLLRRKKDLLRRSEHSPDLIINGKYISEKAETKKDEIQDFIEGLDDRRSVHAGRESRR